MLYRMGSLCQAIKGKILKIEKVSQLERYKGFAQSEQM